MKPSTAKNKATALHSKLVRARGRCAALHWYGHECAGKLETAHIVARQYANTRVRLDNAFCLCTKAHMRFTHWPLEFAEFVFDRIGVAKYQELRGFAESGDKIDWPAELEQLQGFADRVLAENF